MDNTKAHQDLVARIIGKLGREPDVMMFKRIVGRFLRERSDGNVTSVRVGQNGEPDIEGILAPNGRLIALEVKTGTGRTSPAQNAWAEGRRMFGAFVATVHSVDEAWAALARARQGATS